MLPPLCLFNKSFSSSIKTHSTDELKQQLIEVLCALQENMLLVHQLTSGTTKDFTLACMPKSNILNMTCNTYIDSFNNNNNNNNQRQCLWYCPHDRGHCESSPGSFDECRLSTGWPPTLRPSQPTWAVSPPIMAATIHIHHCHLL